MIWKRCNILSIILILFISNCTFFKKDTLFKHIASSHSGIGFINQLTISDSINGITFEYIYNGGGVGIGDLNNDGLKDIFFAGNMVSSRLYLNKGKLKFSDITDAAGLTTNRWCTGVSIIDINDDGLKDIYVCVAGIEKGVKRENILFINQGISENGIPHFKDEAKEYGLNDNGYSTMGVFLDYDKDMDLDLYVLTNSMEGSQRNVIKPIKVMGEAESTDRLYRNEGNGKFTNVSLEAGILIEGFGLGITSGDINQDGWPDIYCSNDFISNDLLWINNQDGTFTESASDYFTHITNNGMGMDIADFNNDALLDVIVLDMLPSSNTRQKLMFSYRNIESFQKSVETGYIPQFMRNTLQLNRNKFDDGKYRFSEIGYLSGIYQTDWSWAPLMADFDNDGWKDLLITNGFRKDVTNLDYMNELKRKLRVAPNELRETILIDAMQKLGEVKLPNYIFRNEGNLLFSDRSEEWGLVHPTFTNGTAIADLDNDGDLDVVLNNIDQEATLYENRLINNAKNDYKANWLTIHFHKSVHDAEIIGLKVWVYQPGNQQFYEYTPYRGYKSTLDPDMHIGLGKNQQIDSLVFQWSDGTIQVITNPPVNNKLEINKIGKKQASLASLVNRFSEIKNEVIFENVTSELDLDFKHEKFPFNDYMITPSLIHTLTSYGPSISVGDINGDGMDDFFIGGDFGNPSYLYLQQADNTFITQALNNEDGHHDMGSLLFDADSDKDLDLYIVSGGYKWSAGSAKYQDRLYINDGRGDFKLKAEALPEIKSSGSCVIAGDYDRDGDLDLFVGARVKGREYPMTPQSYLLENRGGKFLDRSDILGKNQGKLGMVTSAIWTDIDNDHDLDLMVVGEWMPITILKNDNGKFVDESTNLNLSEFTGWWNSINGADFDQDGDTDYIVGNYGLNSFFKSSMKEPVEIYSADFDKNGTIDPVITHYNDHQPFIIHNYNVLLELIPAMRSRFPTYSEYGETPFTEAFTKVELSLATKMDAKMMESVLLENLGNEGLKVHELPLEVHFAPVFGSLIDYINPDGLPDILLVGNSYSDETVTGYYDASYGNVLINQGNFKWKTVPPSASSFIADGDKKSMVSIKVGVEKLILISESNGYLQAMKSQQLERSNWIEFEPDDWYYTIKFGSKKQKMELYYGNGFNSSSTRKIQFPPGVDEIVVYKYDGKIRKITSVN